jgi:predicted nucleotidyltransferase
MYWLRDYRRAEPKSRGSLGSYFATELIKLARSGSGAVQRELQRLEKSGLVKVTRLGNQKHYQANQSAPVFPELRSIMLKTVGLADPLRAALGPLQRQIRLAVLYGSIAKGTDTAFSDIDLLIVSDDLSLERMYVRFHQHVGHWL